MQPNCWHFGWLLQLTARRKLIFLSQYSWLMDTSPTFTGIYCGNYSNCPENWCALREGPCRLVPHARGDFHQTQIDKMEITTFILLEHKISTRAFLGPSPPTVIKWGIRYLKPTPPKKKMYKLSQTNCHTLNLENSRPLRVWGPRAVAPFSQVSGSALKGSI